MIILQQNLICSPLELFEVTNLISIYAPIFGYFNFSLTNLGMYAILSISLIILLHFLLYLGLLLIKLINLTNWFKFK